MRARRGSNRSSARPSVVFPQPLSPISARLSWGYRSKLTPRTARTGPAAVRYSTARSRTERMGSISGRLALPQPRVEDLLERAGHRHQGQLQEADRDDRRQHVEQAVGVEDGPASP